MTKQTKFRTLLKRVFGTIGFRNLLFPTFYFLLSIFIFVYSYGFVDFNLTLSSHPAVTSFIAWSMSLAMFNRPLSSQVFLLLISSSFLLYIGTLVYSSTSTLKRFPWLPIIILALVAVACYPFLSSDVFKYLFSARMVVDYGLNPHLVSPNMVPADDLWLRFMRWIHTPSPYGPVMTALAIPYYLLGFKKFVPTLYLFKLDQAAWYLLSIWLIGKLAGRLKLTPNKVVLAQLFFALNPLVLIEWLVNAHNDAPMIALLLLSLFFLSLSRRLLSFVFLLCSAGIKYVTIILLPFIIFSKHVRASRGSPLLLSVYYLLVTLALVPYFYHYSTQFQPWYITWLIPFAALTASPALMWLTAAYTLGGLLRYLPFIGTGLWGATPQSFALLTYTPLAITTVILLAHHLIQYYRSNTNS